jgi:hypothetical protein
MIVDFVTPSSGNVRHGLALPTQRRNSPSYQRLLIAIVSESPSSTSVRNPPTPSTRLRIVGATGKSDRGLTYKKTVCWFVGLIDPSVDEELRSLWVTTRSTRENTSV